MAYAAYRVRWCRGSMHDCGSGCVHRAHARCRSCRSLVCSCRRRRCGRMCRLVVGSSNASCIGLGNVGRRDELRACCGGGGAWEEALGAAVVAASDAADGAIGWEWQCSMMCAACAVGLGVVHVEELVERLVLCACLGRGVGLVDHRPVHTSRVMKAGPGLVAPSERSAGVGDV